MTLIEVFNSVQLIGLQRFAAQYQKRLAFSCSLEGCVYVDYRVSSCSCKNRDGAALWPSLRTFSDVCILLWPLFADRLFLFSGSGSQLSFGGLGQLLMIAPWFVTSWRLGRFIAEHSLTESDLQK